MTERPQRIVAIDALRGATIAGMILVNNPGSWGAIYPPLRHAKWHGWTPTDLVFPFFLFLVGVSIVFALERRIAAGVPRSGLLRKILVRGAVLFGIGLALNAFPFAEGWLDRLRIPGVLQRIGVCYAIAATLFVVLSWRALVWMCVGCLLGYWAAMVWIPVPEFGAGRIDEPGANLAGYLDRVLIGTDHIWRSAKVYDPEGVLSTIPSVATALLGVFTGRVLASAREPAEKVLSLFVRGASLVVLGYVWDWFFPINKPLWTSSYAVFTAGQAMCALALIAYVTDVRGRARWSVPLQIYGRNALTVFVMSGILAKLMSRIKIGDTSLKGWIYANEFETWASGEVASLAFALTWVAGWFVVLWIMWRRGIVIRV